VILATAATVIASQAVVTGAFSVAHQAVQLATSRGCASCTRPRRPEGSLRAFVDDLHHRPYAAQRVPGVAVFLNRRKTSTPRAMASST
jgi:KUP system potassium uptake protein